MINQTPEMQRINPRDLKGDDRTVYDGLLDDIDIAEEKLKDAKDNPLGRKEAQQARINQLTAKVNDAIQAKEMFLAEGNMEKYFQSGLNRNPADVVEDVNAGSTTVNKRMAPRTDTQNFNPPPETQINQMARGLGIESKWLKTVAGVGMKMLPFLDEEILVAGPATLASKALTKAGYVGAGTKVAGAVAKYSQYETYWMLFNLGLAALNQIKGEIGELSPELQTLIPGQMEGSEPKEFDNAEQFMKDFNRWQKYSPGMQAWKYAIAQPMGYEDNIDMLSSALGGVRGAIGNE